EKERAEKGEPRQRAAPWKRGRRQNRSRVVDAHGRSFTPGQRNRENAGLADALRQLAKTGGGDKLIEFLLRAAAHYPRRPLPVARQRPRDQLELGMPRLARIDEKTPGLDRIGQ